MGGREGFEGPAVAMEGWGDAANGSWGQTYIWSSLLQDMFKHDKGKGLSPSLGCLKKQKRLFIHNSVCCDVGKSV